MSIIISPDKAPEPPGGGLAGIRMQESSQEQFNYHEGKMGPKIIQSFYYKRIVNRIRLYLILKILSQYNLMRNIFQWGLAGNN